MKLRDVPKNYFHKIENDAKQFLSKYDSIIAILFFSYKYLMATPFIIYFTSNKGVYSTPFFILVLVFLALLVFLDIVGSWTTVHNKTKNMKIVSIYQVINLFACAYIPYLLYFYMVLKESLPNVYFYIGVVCMLVGVLWFFVSINILSSNLKKGNYAEDYSNKSSKFSSRKVVAILLTVLSPLLLFGGTAYSRISIQRLSESTGGVLGSLLVLYMLLLVMIPLLFVSSKILIYFCYQLLYDEQSSKQGVLIQRTSEENNEN